MGSEHTRVNFERTARAFLAALAPVTLRAATVEQVRGAIDAISSHMRASSRAQVLARVKSLLGYAKRVGFTQFDPGPVLRLRRREGETTQVARASRVIGQADLALLVRACRLERDRVLVVTLYASGARVSELLRIRWNDVRQDEDGRVRVTLIGKGDKERTVPLPKVAAEQLLAFRNGVRDEEQVFRRASGEALTPQEVRITMGRAAVRARLSVRVSPHRVRHSHAAHALQRGADVELVRDTLGHASIAVTNIYLDSNRDDASGRFLDEGIMRREG
jgi:integrase/recombinase XerD